MDSILKFVALRRPPRQAPAAATLSGESDLQRSLGAATGREEREAAARAFVAHGKPVVSPAAVRAGAELVALSDLLADGKVRTPAKVLQAVSDAVGDARPADWAGDLQRARDTVVASYVLGPDVLDGTVAAKVVRALCVADVVLGAPEPAIREALDIAHAPLRLPDALVGQGPAGEPVPADEIPDAVAERMMQEFVSLRNEHSRVTEALGQVAEHDEDELVLRELDREQPLAELYQAVPAGGDREEGLMRNGPVVRSSPLRRAALRSNVVLSNTAVRLLTESAAQTIRQYGIDPARTPVRDIQARLVGEQERIAERLTTISMDLSKFRVDPSISVDVFDEVGKVLGSSFLEPVDDPAAAEPVASAPPTTHTYVQPLGVADLCVVRTHISRYERGEVASVENVLPGERLTRSTNQVVDPRSTHPLDDEPTSLQALAQSAAEQNTDKATPIAVGAGRGPLTSDDPETFSRSVMDAVSLSSTNRARTTSVLRRTEESVEHVLENPAEAATRFGVYQWLDKIYQAQVFTYGSRLLYDVVVPEPAALFRNALARPSGRDALPPKPAAFTVSANQLTSQNWSYYVSGHRAIGVDAPPQAQICVTENFGRTAPDVFNGELNGDTLEVGECRKTVIPKGYKASSYRAVALVDGDTNGKLSVLIGSKQVHFQFGTGWTNVFSGTLEGEVETIPVGVEVAQADIGHPGLFTLTLGVEIVCVPTDDAIAAWQTRTHGLILAANQQRFAEYEERVAERDAMALRQLHALTPTQKQAIIRGELKRTALAVLTNQNFSGFNATRLDSLGLPFPDVGATDALSAYIRFFEQAVEWDHLEYSFAPYFWGSQSSWAAKLLGSEQEPQFAEFLGCGAARVVLSIRPGYEAAFETFLNTGKIPTTDEPLEVGGPQWASLMAQLNEQRSANGRETTVGDSWEFRIASDLVRARRDGLLPKWTMNGTGWVEQPDTSV